MSKQPAQKARPWMNRAKEIDFLRFFFKQAVLGSGVEENDANRYFLMDQFENETGLRLPSGYSKTIVMEGE